GLSPVGRLFLTYVQSFGYAGFSHSRSQYVESRLHDSVAEILASQSTLRHASRGITRMPSSILVVGRLTARKLESDSEPNAIGTRKTMRCCGRNCASRTPAWRTVKISSR